MNPTNAPHTLARADNPAPRACPGILIVHDLNDDLYDIAFDELQKDHPWIARDLSKSIYKWLRKKHYNHLFYDSDF